MPACVVEDDEPVFSRRGAQATPDHLNEQDPALGRSRHDDAPRVEVNAGREDADVANHARFARLEAGERSLPVLARGQPVHVLRCDAGLDEALGDVLGVPAIHAEAERRPSLAVCDPGFDDIAYELRRVASRGEFPFVKIACDRPDAGKVRLARGEGHEVGEIAAPDQIGRCRRDDEMVPVFSKTACPWCRRQTDKGNVGRVLHPSENFAVELMRLVNNDEVNVRSPAARNCLDGADLDGLPPVGALVDALHDADPIDALGLECGDRLVDQGDGRHREGDALSLVEGAADDVGGRQGLSEAGRRLEHRPGAAGRQRPAQRLKRPLLMRSQWPQRILPEWEDRPAHAAPCFSAAASAIEL